VTLVLRARTRLERGSAAYPAGLDRLGRTAPQALTCCGSLAPLSSPLLALFCSVSAPADAVLAAYDLALALRESGTAVIGGFQSPLERDCLDTLLGGRGHAVVCPARGIEGMRALGAWRAPMDEGRLLVLSPFPARRRRASAAMAEERNRVVAALAERILVLHATPGGRLHRLAAEALAWRKPVYCLDLPANRELMVMGAEPFRIRSPSGQDSPVATGFVSCQSDPVTRKAESRASP
jgi:predicted Rossmann fold nucleotide-binding protein DprA/Smf involved in DNA uptake